MSQGAAVEHAAKTDVMTETEKPNLDVQDNDGRTVVTYAAGECLKLLQKHE